MRSRPIGRACGVAATLLAAGALVASSALRGAAAAPDAPPAALPPASAAAAGAPSAGPERGRGDEQALEGLDLARISCAGPIASAPTARATARLSLDTGLQRTALALMSSRHVPEGAVVLMDVATGRLRVYASHVEKGPTRDLCSEATAPSASVFKIVTAAALVDHGQVGPDTRQCYRGGEQRIDAADLVADPRRDRSCTTLAGALGHSVNAVFARLAEEHLTPAELGAEARRFGYGGPLPFDAPVQPSSFRQPVDSLDLARTAAGFRNTTLSPLLAAEMSAVIARGGEGLRPRIVDAVIDASGAVRWSAPPAAFPLARAVDEGTAAKLEVMMERTVSEGTGFRAFHDARGAPLLPGIVVAGKTGTLSDAEGQRHYTWFTGFAPARPTPGLDQVAIAALVVNGASWRIKASGLACDVLRAYFAERGAAGVSRHGVDPVAYRRR